MQYSLSCSNNGRTAFKFGESPIPFAAHYSKRANELPFPQPCCSSSFQFDLRSRSQSRSSLLSDELGSSLFLSAIITEGRNSELPPVRCGISSNTYSAGAGRSFRDWVELIGEVISTSFPLWVALGCVLGLVKPTSFNWVQPRLTVLGLTVIMLGMGMTLTLDDLRGALAMPKELLAGFVLQYSVMPISGYLVSKLLNLPSYYAAGLILVGCCPGGISPHPFLFNLFQYILLPSLVDLLF
ncbi:Bile acid-sodium symporter/arsenical resistance protein [Parasponia andersonii]|uniref:Bile acid-sodium symporter/arsenical resistance protein n=1 Tax=Parasponia andersonii TaxID=3476 RepID=A0A2P5D938_PARAD|nr:Bile acid-sodium symporter/arsenical resistance protein [Parasponia andersonii]